MRSFRNGLTQPWHPLTRLIAPLALCATLIACGINPSADNAKISGTMPSQRTIDYSWMPVSTWNVMHAEDVAIANTGNVDLLFIGDSITAGWDNVVWQKNFAQYHPANFGIGGDHTGNVLWRLTHGDKGHLKPKAIILLIGVNNILHLHETPTQIVQGITAVVKQLRTNYPNAKILVNGVFPFEESPQSPRRAEIKTINQLLSHLNDNKSIIVKDYGDLFLEPDGSISKEIFGDYLHPTSKGYNIWANAMRADIEYLMQ